MATFLLHAQFVQVRESQLIPLEKRPGIGTRFLQRSGPDGFLEWQVCAFNQSYADSVLAHPVGAKNPTCLPSSGRSAATRSEKFSTKHLW